MNLVPFSFVRSLVVRLFVRLFVRSFFAFHSLYGIGMSIGVNISHSA